MRHLAVEPPGSLLDYVDSLQARGHYTFVRLEAQKAIGATDTAFKFAANRLVRKRRIAAPRRGFFVIVPTEYQLAGAPPASWFIDDLLSFHEMPYYVGLLSAAALHGAAHQQPQEFQVLTASPLRPIRIGREKIRFFTKKQISKSATEKVKGSTGYFLVSTPETTAIDLVRYYSSAGHLSNVATVLSELKEKLSSSRLVDTVKAEGDLAAAQRLGYLLDYVGSGKLTDGFYKWVRRQDPLPTLLMPTRKLTGHPKRDAKWGVVLNEEIEVDE